MKKNKKSTVKENDAVLEPEISQDALANLANKLKVDLAKSTPSHTPSKSSRGQKPSKKNEKQEKQEISRTNGSRQSKPDGDSMDSKNGRKLKDEKSKNEKDHSGRKKYAGSDSKVPQKLQERPRTKIDAPSEPRPSKSERKTNGVKEPTSAEPSLLQEILALGGTKEDLELVNDIDSEEEILDSQPAEKGREKTDEKTVRVSLFPADDLDTKGIARPA
jgi:hypothetical protein